MSTTMIHRRMKPKRRANGDIYLDTELTGGWVHIPTGKGDEGVDVMLIDGSLQISATHRTLIIRPLASNRVMVEAAEQPAYEDLDE